MVWSSVVNLTLKLSFIAITAGLIFRKPWKLEDFLFMGERFGIWKYLINTNLKVLKFQCKLRSEIWIPASFLFFESNLNQKILLFHILNNFIEDFYYISKTSDFLK